MSPVIPTRVAHAGHDSQRFFGHDVHTELLGRTSMAQALLLATTGRRFDEEAALSLSDFSVAGTVADPRIWPLRVTRYGAAYGNALAGLSAGMSFMAEARMGPMAFGPIAARLGAMGAEASDAEVLAGVRSWFEQDAFPAGFGVPFRAVDERSGALRARLDARGRGGRPWIQLHDRVVRAAETVSSAAPNFTLLGSATLLDVGVEPEEVARVALVAALPSFFANAVEQAAHPAEALQRLGPGLVEDQSPADRVSPRAKAASSH